MPFPNAFRGPTAGEALAALRRAFSTLVAAEDVAAIVFEPVQGEGGFIPASREFVEGLREICDEHGIVLVCDEVQSGFARTGRFFAIEHFGVEPDLITVAKSIAMGLPLSGVLGRAEIMDAPLAGRCRRHLRRQPGRDRRRARRARRDRGRGPRRAVGRDRRADAVPPRVVAGALAPDRRRARPRRDARRSSSSRTRTRCRRPSSPHGSSTRRSARGLLLLKAGVAGNCIRVLVPLVISDGELDEALDVWEAALEAAL